MISDQKEKSSITVFRFLTSKDYIFVYVKSVADFIWDDIGLAASYFHK